MHIDKVETAWLRIPSPEPQGLSGGYMTHSSDAVCRITTGDGHVGIGEGRGAPLHEICRIVDEVFRPVLLGADPKRTQHLWQRCFRATHDQAGRVIDGLNPGSVRGALCAIDIALWDLKGKIAGMSVCELLGGKPDPVPAYIQKGFYVEGQGLSEMTDEALEELERGGYRYLKMRVGRNGVKEAVERVEAMRDAIGDDIGLMVDVNSAWEPAEALEGARALEPYNLVWMEEPLPRRPRTLDPATYDWNIELGKLAEQTAIPLAAGESHQGLREFNELITRGRIRYMQLDVAKHSGGVSEWVKVQPICEANDIWMAPHLVPQFHVHLVAAAANGFIVECGDDKRQHPSWPHLFPGWPEVKNGKLPVPDGPGWGLDIDEDFMKPHATVVRWDYGS